MQRFDFRTWLRNCSGAIERFRRSFQQLVLPLNKSDLDEQAVIIGPSSGQVYALNAATGTQLCTANAGGTGNVISGLAAGDGLLVVPAGNTLSAYTLSRNP